MANYTPSRVLSLRIDSALLDGVRERAREEGRSVSGQIVFYVREHVEPRKEPRKKSQPISGWLSHRGAGPAAEEFRRGRAEASDTLRTAVRRKARVR